MNKYGRGWSGYDAGCVGEVAMVARGFGMRILPKNKPRQVFLKNFFSF